jgi:hypothetical protein
MRPGHQGTGGLKSLDVAHCLPVDNALNTEINGILAALTDAACAFVQPITGLRCPGKHLLLSRYVITSSFPSSRTQNALEYGTIANDQSTMLCFWNR